MVVSTRGKHTPARGVPFDGIYSGGVATEFKEGLAGLPDVQDADERGVGGEGGQEMCVVG
jgi:hypothetical protein